MQEACRRMTLIWQVYPVSPNPRGEERKSGTIVIRTDLGVTFVIRDAEIK